MHSFVQDERLREKRSYTDVFFPKRQRHVIILGVSYFLNGSEGDNKSIICPITTTIKLFDALQTNQRYSAFKPIHLLR